MIAGCVQGWSRCGGLARVYKVGAQTLTALCCASLGCRGKVSRGNECCMLLGHQGSAMMCQLSIWHCVLMSAQSSAAINMAADSSSAFQVSTPRSLGLSHHCLNAASLKYRPEYRPSKQASSGLHDMDL